MQVLIIQVLFTILAAVGIYLLATSLFGVSNKKTSRAIQKTANRQKPKEARLDNALQSVAYKLAKLIHIQEFNRLNLQRDLTSADMHITPEQYIANCIVKSGIIALLAVPAALISLYFSAFMLVMAVIMYFFYHNEVNAVVRQRREAIELELPRFVNTIEKTLPHSRDVLGMMEEYRKNAGSALDNELKITLADMRSGNYSSAITRMEARVGSVMMSDVCRGLQAVLRGDENMAFWAGMEIKLTDNQRQILKRKAMQAPKKVHILSMIIMFCFILIYVVVMGVQIIVSLGTIF